MAIFHLIHEHPPKSFKYLGCVRDIAQNLQQTAVRLIYSHPKFKQCTSSVITGLEIYECLEPMPTGVGPTRRMLEDVAKNPLDSDKVKLILEQATQCEDLMVVFSASLTFNFMVFEEFGSSFGRYEWTAHPWDSPKGLYDYVSSVVTPRLGSEEILRALSLYQMPDEDYVKLQEAGKLEPIQLRKTTTLLLDPEAPLWKIGHSNLIFAFTAKRELHIPYALFDGRPNSYQFVHGGRVEATSEDPVKFLHQEFRRLIKPRIPLGTDDYCIQVYEPREALQPSILKDLKLDDNSFEDKSCHFFYPGKKLSEWEGRMLLVVFQISPCSDGLGC